MAAIIHGVYFAAAFPVGDVKKISRKLNWEASLGKFGNLPDEYVEDEKELL